MQKKSASKRLSASKIIIPIKPNYEHYDSETYLGAVYTSLYIYQNMSSQVDRNEVKPMVLEQIKHYTNLINISIKMVNLDLAHTSNYSVTRMGTNLKQDLKKSISILESISKNL